MSIMRFSTIALALASLSAHADPASFCEAAPPLTEEVYEHARLAAHAGADFGLALFRRVKGATDTNVFLSPHSISTALAMTYAGASGATRDAMARGLRLSGLTGDAHAAFGALNVALGCRPDRTYELRSVNALWGQQGLRFNESFLSLVQSRYAGAFHALDFAHAAEAARQTINEWVARETNDRIKDLLARGSVDAATRLVLTNAVYYKAPWRRPFRAAATQPMSFHLADGRTVKVPGLGQTNLYRTAEVDGLRIVELPFVTSRSSTDQAMLVVMPEAHGPTLAALEERLSPDLLERLRAALLSRRVELTMPKFNFSSSFTLKDALTSLGLGSAFDPARADFSGITPDAALAISDAVHKAYIDVNERGVEAAAATAVITTHSSAGMTQPPITVRIDRPFLFLIVDVPTDAVLFLGRVADPR